MSSVPVVPGNMVVITQEQYAELLEDRKWLLALESAGVDNWSGYDYARELYNEDFEDDIYE